MQDSAESILIDLLVLYLSKKDMINIFSFSNISTLLSFSYLDANPKVPKTSLSQISLTRSREHKKDEEITYNATCVLVLSQTSIMKTLSILFEPKFKSKTKPNILPCDKAKETKVGTVNLVPKNVGL